MEEWLEENGAKETENDEGEWDEPESDEGDMTVENEEGGDDDDGTRFRRGKHNLYLKISICIPLPERT